MKTLDDILDEFYEEELCSSMDYISLDQCNYLLGNLERKLNDFYNFCPNWEEIDNNETFQDIITCMTYETHDDSGALISLYTFERDLIACQFLMGKSVNSTYKLKELKMAEILKS